MLDDTLVIWGGEFGRTAYSQGTLTATNYGRDHHPRCYSIWMAGGGIKPGMTYGETDDFSYNITKDPVDVYDVNATIMHLLGIGHTPLTYKFRDALQVNRCATATWSRISLHEDLSLTNPGTRSERSYNLAKEQYAEWGVDVESALGRLSSVSISLHCWQGDDVGGFEDNGQSIGGGLAVTGNYPGRARTAVELRSDLNKTLDLLPGSHRLNLHASYAETGGRKVERDALEPEHFQNWIDWAAARRVGLDFNPTFFAHPLAADGYTLTHPDKGVRRFWIDHGIKCRRIGAAFGRALGTPCITNVWIPDGSKESPIDRAAPRPDARGIARRHFAEQSIPTSSLATRSKKSLASAPRATSSARTSSIMVTRSLARSSSALTPVTITQPRSSPTSFPPCSRISTRSCCT